MPQQYPQNTVRQAALPTVTLTKSLILLVFIVSTVLCDTYITIYGLTQTEVVYEVNPIARTFIGASNAIVGVTSMHFGNLLVWGALYRLRTSWFYRLGCLYAVVMTATLVYNLSLLQILSLPLI